jgi:hypothetical protein
MDGFLPSYLASTVLLARRGPVPFLDFVGVALVPWRLVDIFLTALLLTATTSPEHLNFICSHRNDT